MTVPTASDLLLSLRTGGGNEAYVNFKIAVVTEIDTDGKIRVQYDGESAASTKWLPLMDSYTPAVSDRVLVLILNKSRLVLGNLKDHSAS